MNSGDITRASGAAFSNPYTGTTPTGSSSNKDYTISDGRGESVPHDNLMTQMDQLKQMKAEINIEPGNEHRKPVELVHSDEYNSNVGLTQADVRDVGENRLDLALKILNNNIDDPDIRVLDSKVKDNPDGTKTVSYKANGIDGQFQDSLAPTEVTVTYDPKDPKTPLDFESVEQWKDASDKKHTTIYSQSRKEEDGKQLVTYEKYHDYGDGITVRGITVEPGAGANGLDKFIGRHVDKNSYDREHEIAP